MAKPRIGVSGTENNDSEYHVKAKTDNQYHIRLGRISPPDADEALLWTAKWRGEDVFRVFSFRLLEKMSDQ